MRVLSINEIELVAGGGDGDSHSCEASSIGTAVAAGAVAGATTGFTAGIRTPNPAIGAVVGTIGGALTGGAIAGAGMLYGCGLDPWYLQNHVNPRNTQQHLKSN